MTYSMKPLSSCDPARIKGMSERLMALVGLASLAAFLRWKMSNPLLIAATAVIDGIAFPPLHPRWVMERINFNGAIRANSTVNRWR